MPIKKAISVLCLLIGLSTVSCQRAIHNEALTNLFKGIVDEKLNDESRGPFGGFASRDEGGFFHSRIALDNLKVEAGFDKESISAIAGHFVTLETRLLRLTFQLANGKISSPATIKGEHEGHYETAFESAQFEVNMVWPDAALRNTRHLGIHVRPSTKMLWATGVTNKWTGFTKKVEDEIEQILKENQNELHNSDFNSRLFGRVVRYWWNRIVQANERFIIDEIWKEFPDAI